MMLDYDIIECSSYSSSYLPINIKTCHSNGVVIDQGSRWSSNSNNQQQFLTLKLKQHSIINSVLFGKFHKVHVCNLKEFKIFISFNNKQYIQVLHDGLKNDTDPESFNITSNIKNSDNICYPVQYIKICPLLAHGSNFNFSIWYLQLKGELISPDVVQKYIDYHTELSLKVVLKYLRQKNEFLPIYNQLQQLTNISLEHTYLQKLYSHITNGQFDECYSHLLQADIKWFDSYLSNTRYLPKWSTLPNIDSNNNEIPSRGGHQMVFGNNGIYLYGGWSGTTELNDLWFYDTFWHKIEFASGPSPRSCHKMIYNPNDNSLYTIGKYIDQDSRSTSNLNADFYKFDCSSNEWTCLSNNTASEGGPGLLFDHQMVLDVKRNQLYVFGGKVVVLTSETQYSGLYKYDISTNFWESIPTTISSRISHSMLIHQSKDLLYIFSGQRFKDYLSDMYEYNLSTGETREVTKDYSKLGGPVCGYTQRATIDESRNEIYVFSGLVRDKFATQDTVRNTFWVYHINENKWRMVFQNNIEADAASSTSPITPPTTPTSPMLIESTEPIPRYAHQLAYNRNTRMHYLFGGNPGKSGNDQERLNDFWSLTLNRPTADELIKKIQTAMKIQQ
eukprot:NODE_21_length_38511_cov_0.503306.p6 type:complete len:616 gc:universal NODE_21_length_38511_cov_0.503306:20490-22337(+)